MIMEGKKRKKIESNKDSYRRLKKIKYLIITCKMLNIFQTQRTVEACSINTIACLAEMECLSSETEMLLLAVHYNCILL